MGAISTPSTRWTLWSSSHALSTGMDGGGWPTKRPVYMLCGGVESGGEGGIRDSWTSKVTCASCYGTTQYKIWDSQNRRSDLLL